MFSVLYVDDEPDLLELGKLFLERSPEFHVDIAVSAREALDSLAIRSFDAIISDYQMPEMDGIAFLKAVRMQYGDVPFILFTGRGREEIVIEAINNGVDFYLQKGGDVKSQFAELSHKVKQAVARRQAELSLIESEKRLTDIINFLPDATFAINRDGIIIAWNRAIEEMTGLPAEIMVGKGDHEYALPFYGERRPILIDLIFETDEVIEQKYSHIIHQKDLLIADTRLPRLQGREVILLGKASPLYNSQGEIVGAIEAIRDITEQKTAEDELQAAYEQIRASEQELRKQLEMVVESEQRVTESEEKYRLLEELSPIAVVVHRDGKIVYANPEAIHLSGAGSLEDVSGKDILLFVHPDDRAMALEDFHRIVEEGETIPLKEERLLTVDGVPFTVEVAAMAMLYQHLPSVMVVFRDITERKKTEVKLLAAYEQITASEEELRAQLDVLEESEKKIRESEARLRYMLGFYEKAKGGEKQLLDYAVEGAGAVTGSPLGYLAFLSDDESELSMYAWSKSAMKECSIREKPIVYKTEKTGLWGEAVRQRHPVITNNYAAPDPAKKGYPAGHPEIVRHMNVPIRDSDHIVLVAGVANKSSDYTDEDVQQLTLLMESLWLITKRRRTEQALLESEEKYRDLFENSVVGIFRTTLEGKFSAINTTFARISGYDSPQEMMEAIHDIRTQLYVNPEDRDRFVNGLKRDGHLKNFEAKYRHRDGHPVWILINATAVRVPEGTIRYYEGTIEDITDQKRVADALLQEKTFSDAVLDSIPGLLYLYDNEGRLVRWNKRHETVSGYTAEELAGMHLSDWFTGDEGAIQAITEGVGRALREGEANAEASLLTKSGKRIPFFFTAKRLEIDGKTYFTGVGIDITEQRRAQDELRAAYEQITASEEQLRGQFEELADNQTAIRASEAKFRDLIEASPDMIWEMDTRGVFTYMSPQSSARIGYLPEEVIGKAVFSLVPDYALPSFEEIFTTSARAKKSPAGFDLPLRCSDGHVVIMEIRAVLNR